MSMIAGFGVRAPQDPVMFDLAFASNAIRCSPDARERRKQNKIYHDQELVSGTCVQTHIGIISLYDQKMTRL